MAAERRELAGHHRTFAIAFDRSFARLPDEQKQRLSMLSAFEFPFFRRAAKEAWGLEIDDATDSAASEGLGYFTKRNLLEIDEYSEDKSPVTWRMHPALRQQVLSQAGEAERAASRAALARYATWLMNYGYEEARRQPSIARMLQGAVDPLIRLIDEIASEERAGYCMQLGYMLRLFGRWRTPNRCWPRATDMPRQLLTKKARV